MADVGTIEFHPWKFKDHRGQIVSLSETELVFGGRKIAWHHDMVSVSKQNVLRGIHVSLNLWKLVTCVYGRIFLVVVDCRVHLGTDPVFYIPFEKYDELPTPKLNPGFGKWQSWTIGDADPIMVLVPPGFGLAHLVLSKQAVFYYKWSSPYDGPEQESYRYDDPRFGIKWPILHELNCTTRENIIVQPILSERDKN